MIAAHSSLPDPVRHAEFYDDVPLKRFLAWVIDVIVITSLSLVLTPLTLFTSIFFFPVFYLAVGFCYRSAAIARLSGTPGMRIMSLMLVNRDGDRMSMQEALLHSTGFTITVVTFPLQLLSGALMIGTARRQGLTDLVMGSAAINRAAA